MAEFENHLGEAASAFEIENSAKMFDILSNRIYEDVPRAIIRELSCNAIDAHLDINSKEPIKVYFPTSANPSIIIEDSGVGMTHEDIITVYKSYGKSTKSSSNKTIGALGLGGKTPLAYTQQFTLVTAKDGKRNSYIIYKDDQGIPNVTLVKTEDCTETGTSIEMIVRPEDFDKFFKAAIKTFIFFDVMPVIMRGEERFYDIFRNSFARIYQSSAPIKGVWETTREVLKKDVIDKKQYDQQTDKVIQNIMSEYNTEHGIVMGQIFYSVNTKQIVDIAKYGTDGAFFLNFPTVQNADYYKILHVDLGSVSIQPSREALNYNKQTVALLRQRFYEHFENWKTMISTYKSAKSFLVNFRNIPYVDKLRFCREKAHNGNKSPDVLAITGFEKDVIRNVFKSAYSQNSLINIVTANYHSAFEVKNIIPKDLTPDVSDDGNVRIMFDHLFYDKTYSHFLIVDDAKQLDKLRTLYEKANEKGRGKFTCPIAIRNRLKMKDISKAVLIDEATYKLIPVYARDLVPVLKFSEIDIPKESSGSGKRRTVDLSGKCWDLNGKKYVTISDIIQAAKSDPVVYEFFEGEPNRRGWFYHAKMSLIDDGISGRNKQDYIDIYHHGGWEDTKMDHYINLNKHCTRLGFILPTPAHNYLVDWNFFKKNDLRHLKNAFYINEFIFIELKKQIPQIEQIASNIYTYSKSICDAKMAKALLEHGAKYPGFDNTIFGSEMVRILQERSKPEVNATTISTYLSSLISELKTPVFITKDYDTAAHRGTVDFCMKKLDEELKKLPNTTTKSMDYSDLIIQKYPMFKFLSHKMESYSTTNVEFETMVDYVALVEGLK
jgi:hypothetical protein